MRGVTGVVVGFLAAGLMSWSACAGGEKPPEKAADAAEKAEKPAEAAPAKPAGPAPSLLMVQAQFVKKDGKPVPGPAKLVILRKSGDDFVPEVVEDPESNVFHKAMPYDGGILTIGAMKARLALWKSEADKWTPTVLWEKSWGGKFDRLRDIEIGDLNGDGKDEMAIATHDQGVVAVGTQENGAWTFAEFDQKADTFVHEVEIGDVDADGKKEFYVTPSDRNRSSGESQPGGVARYDFKDGKYERSQVVFWENSHAKEILVADMDGDGKDELFAVREAHTVKNPETNAIEIKDPVRIVRLTAKGGKFEESIAASLDDKQTRFILPADVDGDGKKEMIAAGMDSGLWMLKAKGDGTFENVLIDANSGGFEHATHAADLDKDGKLEIYVASDKNKEVRRYIWNGTAFDRKVIYKIGPDHITWNLQDGVF